MPLERPKQASQLTPLSTNGLTPLRPLMPLSTNGLTPLRPRAVADSLGISFATGLKA